MPSNVKKGIVDELYHQPRKTIFLRRSTKMVAIDNLWQIDLADVQSISKQNRSYRYLFCIIDTFSRYAFVEPLKTKTGGEITEVFENLLNREKRQPKLIHADEGKEWYNKTFLSFLNKRGIHMYSTTTHMKAAICERFQKTLKSKMYKMFAYNGSFNYIDHLQDLVDLYNNTPHRSLGFFKPNQINKKNEKFIYEKFFKKPKIFKEGKLKLNDYVRILDRGHVFTKGYEPHYSTAIFQITKVQKTYPVSYKITDKYTGQTLDTIFYEPELLKTKYPDTFLVEKVLKKKGKKSYVKYLGFDRPEWEYTANLV